MITKKKANKFINLVCIGVHPPKIQILHGSMSISLIQNNFHAWPLEDPQMPILHVAAQN